MTVHCSPRGAVWVIEIDRPEVRNAVDHDTALALYAAFERFEAAPEARVAVLTGTGGHFCAGADLKAIAAGRANPLHPIPDPAPPEGDWRVGPMGPTRMDLSRPVIAAIEGYAVAGGLELACWCDLRVAAEDATLGVFCRRWGVPLIDGGTVRLPRLIGQSHALDLILTGRAVSADEARSMGLINRVVPSGHARAAAIELAASLAQLPDACLQADRAGARASQGPELPLLRAEFERGLAVLAEGRAGAARFAAGAGRHGAAERQP